MRFTVESELELFHASVDGALAGWEPPREPALGTWQDDRDRALDERLRRMGWDELWLLGEHGPAVAGGFALGAAVAPLCTVDEATLGGALAVAGRARHGLGAKALVLPRPGGALALGRVSGAPGREPALDGSGTIRVELAVDDELDPRSAAPRWRAWSACTLAYYAGLVARTLELAVAHVRTREQFGRPLAALPAVQARLADAALAVDAATLLAWAPAPVDTGPWSASLRWAGEASCDAVASALQVHGALAFALESGLHAYFRRVRSAHVWTTAACEAAR